VRRLQGLVCSVEQEPPRFVHDREGAKVVVNTPQFFSADRGLKRPAEAAMTPRPKAPSVARSLRQTSAAWAKPRPAMRRGLGGMERQEPSLGVREVHFPVCKG
jgi:hypothetical protein